MTMFPTLFLKFLLTHLLRGVTGYAVTDVAGQLFLLTHLLRGVTAYFWLFKYTLDVSTHTPLARCDAYFWLFKYTLDSFYSHTSCEV